MDESRIKELYSNLLNDVDFDKLDFVYINVCNYKAN